MLRSPSLLLKHRGMKGKTPPFELTAEEKAVLATRVVEFRHATRSDRRHIALAVAKELSKPNEEPRMYARYLTVSIPSETRT